MRQDPLLTTKLYIPPIRPGVVPRPRLIEKLNEGRHRKLTLISAPAGFGKTTLLSKWVADNQPPVAWLSLDEGDSDPIRFLTYLITAIQTIDGNVGQGVLVALQSPDPVNIEGILTTLINELVSRADQLVLVLDDYHVVESPLVDRALSFLLDHLPPSMCLVIATRTDPTLPISRLRARGALSELRADDLRFTTDEAMVFLKRTIPLPILSDDVEALGKRTEGWITGLQLAAVAMQSFRDRDQIVRFIDTFSGNHRYVIDYLVDEVLEQQTPLVQAFLLRTSVLDRMTASLCDAVMGWEDSQTILDQLEVANLFLIPLDGERRWYRYHHLFADLLMHRLTRTSTDLIPELHRRASVWYEREGDTDDAFRHAQLAGDTRRAVNIIEEHWQDIVHKGELTKLRRWLDSIGPEFAEKSAPLSMAYCWIHHLTGDNDALPGYIQDTRKALEHGSPTMDSQNHVRLAVIPSLLATMDSIVALRNKSALEAKSYAQKAISLIPIDLDRATRGLLHGAAGYRLAEAHRRLGEYDQAVAVLLDVLDMLKVSQNCLGMANAIWAMATIYRESGKTPEAIALCEDNLGYIREHHWENMPSSGMIYLVLASLQADSGHQSAAKTNLEIGQKLVEPLSSPEVYKLADRVQESLDGVTPPSPPLVEPLSQRELQVLEMIAQGLTNREISERLFIVLDTVKGHNSRIYGKLGVRNRTQAVNKAISLKIIPPR